MRRPRTRLANCSAMAFLALLLLCARTQAQSDPLPSWNDGPAKRAIVELVTTTTDPASPEFVPPEARIATFDQDGTTWVSHPMYTQVIYCLDRVPAVVARKPELKNVEPFKTVLSGNREAIAKLSMKDLEKILAATLSGMTVDEFSAEVDEMDRERQAPALGPPLHRADLPADARGDELSARERLQDLYRHRRRPGFRARLFRADLWHPARAGGRHGGRNKIRLRQERQADPDQGAEAAAERQ